MPHRRCHRRDAMMRGFAPAIGLEKCRRPRMSRCDAIRPHTPRQPHATARRERPAVKRESRHRRQADRDIAEDEVRGALTIAISLMPRQLQYTKSDYGKYAIRIWR